MSRYYHRRFQSRVRPFFGRPDATPFIDVFFLLLIFLMISTPFVQVSGVEVKLPRVSTGSGRVGLERFIITVSCANGKNQLYFNDKPLAMNELAEELAAVGAQTGMNMVIIRADAQTPHGIVAEIMAIAARFKLGTFLATNEPEEKAARVRPPGDE